ncbi:hypothetical protein [Edaphocola aurantiacus]|uniref:hypothetical protein n=1 Tax=Edaphocola aurantiacus TaxID=2601682 RepID=UPI001C93A05B|nr:hypothetical protein [Edaphocola aurantiacus]
MENIINLSKLIILSQASKDLIYDLHFCLREYADYNNFDLDWDVDDGEQWGRVLSAKEQIVLFHSKLPIVFVQSSFNNQLTTWFDFKEIKLKAISIADWKSNIYIFTSQDILDKISWDSYKLGERFSINDLWYNTV